MRQLELRQGPRISIHALREEGDEAKEMTIEKVEQFLSTPSARRATQHNFRVAVPRMDFYPRPPRGGRLVAIRASIADIQFLSTPSARRATRSYPGKHRRHSISIHALREEGDSKNRDKISIFKQIIQHSARI